MEPDVHAPNNGSTCYGFEAAADSPIMFGRTGSGDPLQLTTRSPELPAPLGNLFYEWSRIPGKRAHTAIFATADTYDVTIGGYQHFRVNPAAGTIEVWGETESALREGLLWGTPIALCAVQRGDLLLHAAAVEADDCALLLAAPTTSGKTTLAAAFHAAGYRALSDDLSCCRTGAGAWVLPGPALLRMRPDMAEQLNLSDTDIPFASEAKIYHAVDRSRRGSAAPVPLAGVVFLRDHDGEMYLEERSMRDALRDLWGLSFFLPTDEDHERCFAGLADLVGRVPSWDLYRPIETRSLPDVVSYLAEQIK